MYLFAYMFEIVIDMYPLNYCFFWGAFISILVWALIWVKEYYVLHKRMPNPFVKYYDAKQKNWGPFAGAMVLREYFTEVMVIGYAIIVSGTILSHYMVINKNVAVQKGIEYFCKENDGNDCNIGFIVGDSQTIGSDNRIVKFRYYDSGVHKVNVHMRFIRHSGWEAVRYTIEPSPARARVPY